MDLSNPPLPGSSTNFQHPKVPHRPLSSATTTTAASQRPSSTQLCSQPAKTRLQKRHHQAPNHHSFTVGSRRKKTLRTYPTYPKLPNALLWSHPNPSSSSRSPLLLPTALPCPVPDIWNPQKIGMHLSALLPLHVCHRRPLFLSRGILVYSLLLQYTHHVSERGEKTVNYFHTEIPWLRGRKGCKSGIKIEPTSLGKVLLHCQAKVL